MASPTSTPNFSKIIQIPGDDTAQKWPQCNGQPKMLAKTLALKGKGLEGGKQNKNTAILSYAKVHDVFSVQCSTTIRQS